MMLLVVTDARTAPPGCKTKHDLYQILGTDAIWGLRRCLRHYDYEIGMENVYRLWPNILYELSTRFVADDGECVHEESRFYHYEPEGLRQVDESELPEILEAMKNAAQVLEHPDGEQE